MADAQKNGVSTEHFDTAMKLMDLRFTLVQTLLGIAVAGIVSLVLKAFF
jgi:hypothetical protein